MTDLTARIQVLEDIEAIRKLKARYCAACDDDHNPIKLAELFAEDATWSASTMGKAEGRAAICEKLAAVGTSGKIKRSAHNVFNPDIEVAGVSATGSWRLLMLYTENQFGGYVQYQRIIGRYEETYSKLDGRWYFQTLHCEVEESAPYPIIE